MRYTGVPKNVIPLCETMRNNNVVADARYRTRLKKYYLDLYIQSAKSPQRMETRIK